ncbi:MAG: lysostaphin resistance A-like protein [Anaerolineae bacterium]
MQLEQPKIAGPNWKQVALFVGVTFALTYLLDLVLFALGGLEHAAATQVLQFQMMIPAGVAIALQLFVFHNSPIHRLQGAARWAFYLFLALALFLALLTAVSLLAPNNIVLTVASLATLAASVGVLVLMILIRLVAGKEAFAEAGLSGGRWYHYVLFGLALVLIYGAMTGLNALFDLGQAVDLHEMLGKLAGGEATGVEQIPAGVLLLVLGGQNILLAPLLGLVIAFGEEYGWRSYLQGELIRMGKIRGLLLVGVIWGLWHAPIIAMGYNYPGYPLLGILLMTLYTIALAFFLGYAMFKSGSVWLAAYLHALNNATASFLLALVYQPDSPVLSFGLGIYGMIVWAVVIAALLILDRKMWASPSPSGREAEPAEPVEERVQA